MNGVEGSNPTKALNNVKSSKKDFETSKNLYLLFLAFTDRFSFKSEVENPMEYYRIIILPWPEFTDAFKTEPKSQGGTLIEGTYAVFKSLENVVIYAFIPLIRS